MSRNQLNQKLKLIVETPRYVINPNITIYESIVSIDQMSEKLKIQSGLMAHMVFTNCKHYIEVEKKM